jgi:hypothetical protein
VLVAGCCQYKRCYSNQIVQSIKMASMYRQKWKNLTTEHESAQNEVSTEKGASSKCFDEVENRLDAVQNLYRQPAWRGLP